VLPRGGHGTPRENGRRILNGIFRVLRSGVPWRDRPERYGPYTRATNLFNRWRKAGDRSMDAIAEAYDG